MNYTVKKTDDYKVLLKPNEFYETDTLEAGGYYPSMAVKSYVIDFGYDFKSDKSCNLQYNYNVTAELIGICTDQEGEYKEIWNRKFNVLETKTCDTNSDNFSINEEVNIDYEYYYNMMLNYEETYGVQLDGILKVKFNIDFPDLNGKEVKDNIELDINLNEVITNLEENYRAVKSNITNIPKEEKNTINVAMCIVITIVVFYSIFEIFKMKNQTPKDKYKRRVRKILRYCKDLIVIVKKKPCFDNLEIVKIENLDSLINLAEQTKSNIIYYEEIKDKKSNFCVISGNFVYILKVEA